MMKYFLIVTAIIETVTGVSLAITPSVASAQILESGKVSPGQLILLRVFGGVLIAVGLACGMASKTPRGQLATTMAIGMLIYNVGTIFVCLSAKLAMKMPGNGLWMVVALHTVMTVWNMISLRETYGKSS